MHETARPTPRLWRHKNGTWYVIQTTGRGRSSRLSTGTKVRSEAEVFLDQFTAGLNAEAERKALIKDMIRAYAKRGQQRGMRSVSRIMYSHKHLELYFGNLLPDQIRQAAVDRYADKRLSEGGSAGTILRELGVLKAAIKAAQHPVTWQMPVKQPLARDRWLTEDEAEKLLRAVRSPHLRLFITLALTYGPRRTALLELTWDRVDFGNRLIDFGQGHGNKKRAKVPMPDHIVELLRSHRAVSTGDHVIEYNGKPIKSVRAGLHKACIAAGIEPLGTHVFRHTAATWSVKRGESFERVARLIGTTVAMVEKVYGHHAPDFLASTVNPVPGITGLSGQGFTPCNTPENQVLQV